MSYDYRYLGMRRSDIDNVSPNEVDDCFRILREKFSDEWLETNGTNVIQRLWARKDTLATRELFSLGYSIKLLREFNDFIEEKINLIKTDDPKNWNGALFEIYALSFFKNYNVKPARRNQAGYDGTVEFTGSKKLKISIKNFSISKHHDAFLFEARQLNNLTKRYLDQFNMAPIEIIMNKVTSYPSDHDWKLLKDNYHGIFIEYNKGNNKFSRFTINDWSIIVKELTKPEGNFSNIKKSYTLIISAPFHANEEKNLFDKLEEACANLVRHGGNESKDEKNLVIIHLPKIASREACHQWAENYFQQYPNKPISSILLYQPLVVSNFNSVGTHISNGISFINRRSFFDDFQSIIPIKLSFSLGATEQGYIKRLINIQETETEAINIDMTNYYVFQRGHHYNDSQLINGSAEGEVNKVASGIFSHSIINIFNKYVEISGLFEPVDELEIM